MANELYKTMSKEELLSVVDMYSKNWLAMDGVWFQSVEKKYGMKEAIEHDENAWTVYTITIKENTLLYRTGDCRVQTARKRKNMPFHPCKSVGIIEYGYFAKTIDDRISCECSWLFTLQSNRPTNRV